jgi:hypothetical protein
MDERGQCQRLAAQLSVAALTQAEALSWLLRPQHHPDPSFFSSLPGCSGHWPGSLAFLCLALGNPGTLCPWAALSRGRCPEPQQVPSKHQEHFAPAVLSQPSPFSLSAPDPKTRRACRARCDYLIHRRARLARSRHAQLPECYDGLCHSSCDITCYESTRFVTSASPACPTKVWTMAFLPLGPGASCRPAWCLAPGKCL